MKDILLINNNLFRYLQQVQNLLHRIKIIIHFPGIILIHILISDTHYIIIIRLKKNKKEVQLIWKNNNYNKHFYNI
nr:MAG TPA: hypothetical protein [Caudoviricetes sp.]